MRISQGENMETRPIEDTKAAPFSKIAEALAKAQISFGEIKKDATVNAGKFSYKYATLSNIIDCIKKPLADNGIAVTQPIICKNNIQYLQTRLLHTSGESIESMMPINTAQAPQQLGSLLTYYRRYQLSSILAIAADEDDDGQAAQQGAKEQTKPRAQQSKAPPKKIIHPNGINSDQLKFLHTTATTSNWKPDECKAMIRSMFGLETSKDLNPNQFQVLLKTIQNHTFKRAMEAFMSESKEEPPQENQGQDGPMFADDEIGF